MWTVYAICPKEAISVNGYDMSQIEGKEEDLNTQKILDVIHFRKSIRRFQDKKYQWYTYYPKHGIYCRVK